MQFTKKSKQLTILFLFSIYFIIIFFLNNLFINISGWDVSIVLLLGFTIIILLFFIFFNLNHNKNNDNVMHFRILSENSFKILLFILIIIIIFIPPVLISSSLVLWEKIYFYNYLRAIIAILGYSFLPGASLYNIIFPDNNLSKQFKIEPFFLKITLYPLISFSFLGVFVLIFDQFGLLKKQIELSIFIVVIIVFFTDLILQKKRYNSINLRIMKINISKYTLIILLLAIGISTISIGFQIGWQYLTSGDPWGGIKYANLIGEPNKSPIFINNYPNFWGYFSFGISMLSGLPYININTLLAPFSYMFITSIYLLMKSILLNFKESYAVLSTILISMFSGLYPDNPIFSIVMGNEFYFTYKSYSYILFFISLALFFLVLNNKSKKDYEIMKLSRLKELRYITLGAFLLIFSFMTYMFPLLLGMIFLFLLCIFLNKKEKLFYFNLFIFFTLIVFILYISFDILLQFYLSYTIIQRFLGFFTFKPLTIVIEIVPPPILVYSILILIFFIVFCLKFLITKVLENFTISITNRVKILKKVSIILLIIFILISIVELIILILEYFILKFNLSEKYFFFLYLDYFFLNIGFIGLIGLFFSYYCLKRDKYLFLTLFSWIFFSFLLALSLIFIENLVNFPLSPENLSEQTFFMMDYWFDRIWIYSIPAFCIFASIGLLEILSKIKKTRIYIKYKSFQPIPKNIIALSLILFSFSGIIFSGILYGNTRFRYSKPAIVTLNWISENIPLYSGVLVGDNFFMGVGVDSITFVRQYFFYDIFEEDFNESKCIEQIGYLKNATIQFAVISQFFISYYLNKSDFTNNILIPQFYNITLFEDGDLSVKYAPYFD